MNEQTLRRRTKPTDKLENEKSHIAHGIERDAPKKLSVSKYIHFLKASTAFLALLAYLVYFAFRIKYVYEAKFSSVNDQVIAYLYLLVEISIPVHHNVDRILHIAARNRHPVPSYAVNISEEHLPQVDVLILCSGEAEPIVSATARAACRQNYPRDKYRVFVSDDSDSPGLRKAICNLYSEFDNLSYIARGGDHEADFKTSNLNFAAGLTLRLRTEPSAFIAQLDADVVPDPNWLPIVVRHVLSDERLGMVTAPQSFTNIPPLDPMYQLTSAPGAGALKGTLEVAQSTGSGYIIRRSALVSIGGFPQDISEDTSISFLLMADGWRVTQVDEKLQFGLFPDTLWGHIQQRSRWVTANIDLLSTFNHLRRTGSLTIRQLLIACGIIATAAYHILFSISLVVLPFLLLSRRPLIPNLNLPILLPLATALVLTGTLHDVVLCLGSGTSMQVLSHARDAQPWSCPFYLGKYVNAIFPRIAGYGVSVKKPYDAPDADHSVYDPALATTYTVTSQLRRAFATSTDTKIIIGYSTYAALVVMAVLRIWFSDYTEGIGCVPRENYTCFLQHLFCEQRLFWPGLLWLDVLRWALVPICYGICGDSAGTSADARELLRIIWTVVFTVIQCLWGALFCKRSWGS